MVSISGVLGRISLGTGPACQHESNLVDEVCNVVHQIQWVLLYISKAVTKEVTKRVDGPADCHNHAHGVEGSRNCLAGACGSATGFTIEDLVENEEPTRHAAKEASHCRHDLELAHEAKREHADSAKQEPPEHASTRVLAGCLEDQVEFNHLQRDGDAPVHIAVDDGRTVNLHPVLTHVHVVHTCHQSDQTTHMQGCLPVRVDSSCLCKEKHC